ncbi:energy transducer TonB [Candidatus Nitrospira bockiana]
MAADTSQILSFGSPSRLPASMRWMVAVSLVLHVVFLLSLSGLRMSKSERPLASYQVSLVTLPTPKVEAPAPKPVEPTRSSPVDSVAAPRPTPQVAKEKPVPEPVRLPPPAPILAPTRPIPKVKETIAPPATPSTPPVREPMPPAAVVPPPAVRSSQPNSVHPMPPPPPSRPALNRDVLRGFNLPDVPKLGEVKPLPTGSPEAATRTDEEVQKLIKALDVPQPSIPAPAAPDPARSRVAPPRASVSEELAQQLQKLAQPPPPPPAPAQRLLPPEPQVAAKPPATKGPVTSLQLPGVNAGNPYLALVQKRISNQWVAPQVESAGRALQVVIRFRLERSGRVSDIAVEQSSGNEYYDLAAKRAVLAANPLPAFPSDMGQAYLDAHFSFTVGESVS